jgi:hypothetical protein
MVEDMEEAGVEAMVEVLEGASVEVGADDGGVTRYNIRMPTHQHIYLYPNNPPNRNW